MNDTSRPSIKKSQKEIPRDIACAQKVLNNAISAIQKLKVGLDNTFIKAVDLISLTKGRVIISGMGKSGHIGRKIAATLASTGTPSFFIHPSEASHGDLGMIMHDDLILALSNSGESAELNDIVAYSKRYDIPLVSITSKTTSTLSEAATVSLTIPEFKEACPHGLAPTTSTTSMLALGDAIAITLLERTKFSPEQFHLLHPGGKLGQQLLKVSDLMHKSNELPIVSSKMKMSEAIIVMTAKHFGCLGVIDEDGYLKGVITDGDLRRNMQNGLLNLRTAEIMTFPFKTIDPNALAGEGLNIMNIHSITNLFVTIKGKPVGLLHVHDCLRAGLD